jgi:thiamine monophosphate synthase
MREATGIDLIKLEIIGDFSKTLYPDVIETIKACEILKKDGLHLGQEDLEKIHKDKNLAIKLVRIKIKDKLLGLSTHNEIEILEANELNLDMIGLGAYKQTNTKSISSILSFTIVSDKIISSGLTS